MRQFVVFAGVFGVKGKEHGGRNGYALLLAGGWPGCSRGLLFYLHWRDIRQSSLFNSAPIDSNEVEESTCGHYLGQPLKASCRNWAYVN